MKFAHLHMHSDHSFLDGVGRSEEYAELASSLGMESMALTDHGNLYGLPAHRRACREAGIKPIYGVEMYCNDERERSAELYSAARAKQEAATGAAAGFRAQLDPTFTDAHLILLAADADGWRNMLAINHDAVRNGYYYKPRTTHDFVCEHAKGLIATTACIGSIFGRLILAKETSRLRFMLRQFKDAFGDRFYYEVQYNELPEQKQVNAILRAECTPLGIKPVLTSDVHYACKGDDARQDEMIATSRWTRVDAPDAFKLSTRGLYLSRPRDAAEYAKKYAYDEDRAFIAGAAVNAYEAGVRCTADIYGDGKLRPPPFVDDAGNRPSCPFEFLKSLALAGYRERVVSRGLDSPEYRDRLKRELLVIRSLNMADFYLVTWDVIRECKARGIFVWTRGSGCASLVAACIGITQLNPIRFGLLFERFVDPSRPNAPDFDLDIDSNRRHEILTWLEAKYGGPDGDRVARICSVQTFGIRAALRDVLKSRGIDDKTTGRLAALTDSMRPAVGFPVPHAERELAEAGVADRDERLNKTVEELHAVAPHDLKVWIDQNEPVLRGALTMVGRARGRSLHAAGYVVSPAPLSEIVPVDQAKEPGTDRKIVATVWSEGQATQDLAETGLMKLDLLGLVTCSVVSMVCAAVKERRGVDLLAEIDAWDMDYADPATLREFATGNGFGLHQLQEQGQQLAALLKKLKPKSVDDVVAAVALYRPGAMDYMDEFVERAAGRSEAPPVEASYDEIASETHGVLVYQEQIMLLLHRLGGVTLRDAYGTIKAISKKKLDKIEHGRESFLVGASAKVGDAVAGEIFENVLKFAGYGFNKAHAASYGVLSWITAYQRARYPLEFWWAWLCLTENKAPGRSKDPERKIEVMMRRARAAGIVLHPPTLGAAGSRWGFTKSGGLVAPLSLISGVGNGAADALAAAGPWKDLWDFIGWAEKNGKVCNAKVLTALAKGGALRRLAPTAEAVDVAAAFSASKASKGVTRARAARDLCEKHPDQFRLTRPDAETYAVFERDALGFTFWRDSWAMHGRAAKAAKLESEGRIAREGERNLRGKRRAYAVAGIKRHTDKKGGAMAFLTLTPRSGASVKGVVFASTWKTESKTIKADKVYLVRGEFDDRGGYVVQGADPFRDIDSVPG